MWTATTNCWWQYGWHLHITSLTSGRLCQSTLRVSTKHQWHKRRSHFVLGSCALWAGNVVNKMNLPTHLLLPRLNELKQNLMKWIKRVIHTYSGGHDSCCFSLLKGKRLSHAHLHLEANACLPFPFCFFAFLVTSLCDVLNQFETVHHVDLTACSISLHGVGVFMLLPTSVFVLELSPGLVSFSTVYKEMLIWIAGRGQCRGCRSDSYPSPWSSLPINIITTQWKHKKHTHSQQAHTHAHSHTHKLLIQIGANRLAVIINKHGGLILCALSLLFHWASQGNYQVLDC